MTSEPAGPGRLRLGILGTGKKARGTARDFASVDGVELAACYDLRRPAAEAFAADEGVAHVASSVDELIDRVDAVAIVSPDPVHAEQCLAAFAAGRHLFY